MENNEWEEAIQELEEQSKWGKILQELEEKNEWEKIIQELKNLKIAKIEDTHRRNSI